MMLATEFEDYVRYDDKELDEESLRIVKKELKETDENKKKCLETLKKKLLDKEDLNAYLYDEFLIAYLRVGKYDVNKAYQRIIKYYEERWNYPEVFKDYLPSSVRIVEEARQAYASPYRLKDNKSALIFMKRSDYDTSKIPYELIIRGISMAADFIALDELNQMCGVSVVMDLKSSFWSSSWGEYTPARLKLLARLIQKSVPLRLRSVHIMNAPPIYFLIHSIVYPFLSIKIRNRIFLHKNNESLHSYIDPKILPKEYGGCLEHSDLINLLDRLQKGEEYFCKFSKYGFIKKKK